MFSNSAKLAILLVLTVTPASAQNFSAQPLSGLPQVSILGPSDLLYLDKVNPSSPTGYQSVAFPASQLLSFGFLPTPSYSQLSVSGTSANVALPAGAEIIVYNTGSNAAYVKMGTSSVVATSADDLIPPGGAVSFQVGSNTYIAGIETAGLTALNISGGVGLPTGWGGTGGSGGGGGGTSANDESTFTAGTSAFTPSGGFYQTTPTANALTAGQWGTLQLTANRALFVNLRNSSGTEIGTASTPVQISQTAAADPCMFQAKTSLAVSSNATGLTQIIAASASTKIYICSIALVAAGATAFNLNTGTGSNCGASTAAVMGSTTAANGMSLVTNGGLAFGNGGSTIAIANVAGAELCTLQSNAVYVSGNLTFVQQ